MTDRLEEIKVRRTDATNGSWTTDLDWLIAEIERLTAEDESYKVADRHLYAAGLRAGMERAAKLVGVVRELETEHLRTTIIRAILAEVK